MLDRPAVRSLQVSTFCGRPQGSVYAEPSTLNLGSPSPPMLISPDGLGVCCCKLDFKDIPVVSVRGGHMPRLNLQTVFLHVRNE